MNVVPAVERAWWPGLAALIAANLVPLLGVAAFGWDLGLVFLLYWAESAVILVFSLVKVGLVARLAGLFLIPFFVVHTGVFMLGHLVFIGALFVDRPADGWSDWLADLGLGIAVLFLSHLVSFAVNTVWRGERQRDANAVMKGFYGRIVVMHLTIIFGGFLAVALGSPTWAVALLVVLKTLSDAVAHLRERRKAQPAPELDEASRLDIERARRDMQGNP